jgi:sterol desaturase/sphingolipid hydroxylase (fatty acid hydroxylase superfamily)
MQDTTIDWLLGTPRPLILYAVPFFLLLIGVEILVGIASRRRFYRFNDSVNDLSCGIIDQVTRIFFQGALFAGYLYLYRHWRLTEMTEWSAAAKWGAAIALVLGVDLGFYWFHRIAHEYSAPWATHVVHHQSEEYNLAVALRQSAFESCFAWIFYLPLALIGFPPLWYATISAINLLYQFWVHTEAIDRLGPLEWVMNTPSHHRVHHARNPKYLDKNYAGMFIIWDRMFGTFQVEEEQPVYGLTRPLESWNPIWANLHYWVHLWRQAREAPYWTDKIKIWFMPLGWTPRGVAPYPPAQEVTRESVKKYNAHVGLGMTLYVLFQFSCVLVGAVVVMGLEKSKPVTWLATPAALVFWSLANLGAIFERRPWAGRSELARIGVTGAVLASFGVVSGMTWLAIAAGAWTIVSLAWLWPQRATLAPREAPNAASAVTETSDRQLASTS